MTVADAIQSLSNVYRLLSRMWIQEIDRDLLDRLQSSELRGAFEALGGIVPAATMLDDLLVDYCRLFIGPQGHLPLVQSIWDRDRLESDVTDSVRAFAELFGYVNNSQFADHFGVQLDMMGHALQLPKTDATAESLTMFFDRHLMWSARLLHEVKNRDDSKFYQSLARVTQDFLKLRAV